MYAHLLQEEVEENSDLRRDLSLIAEQADRCKSIVAGLLDFARQNRVLHQETNACELVSRALRSVPAPMNVELEQHCETSDLTCEVDPDQVLQVLTNLISNAYAAMPDGGVLTTRVAEDEDDIVLEISDTGTGIPEENRKKIFEPFFTTKRIGKGTGLGLSVAYGVVKMHRGRITVESNDDPAEGPTGSTFRVFLPRQGRME
jgi:signal transduction histidine kinase